MKVAVLVVGALRNFQLPMSNWHWPEEFDIEYHLITWDTTPRDETTHNVFSVANEYSVFPDLPLVKTIINPKSITLVSSALIKNEYPSCIKMLFLWKKAAAVAGQLDTDMFILIRPDLFLIPFTLPIPSHKLCARQNDLIIAHSIIDGQITFVQDCIMIFTKNFLPTLWQLYDMVVEKYGINWIDIHKVLSEIFQISQQKSIINIKSGILSEDTYWIFVSRRAASPAKLTEELLADEMNFTKWFWENKINGGIFCTKNHGLPKPLIS